MTSAEALFLRDADGDYEDSAFCPVGGCYRDARVVVVTAGGRDERIRSFSNIIFEAGISAPVRTPRGRDIDAACGQLKTAAERKRRTASAA